MAARNVLITAALIALCGGILVLFTDVEVGLVRWVNCGPLSTPGERDSNVCR
ncbi:hypothetical protein [Synechococcus sp. RSCCF101]|uniref:hypothetical protein n=1 Tax=Synechococcus sp. RSCCF101 TaxID=2511069 RepID=UPI00177A8445|nr:hypothetical protein [Synechococcus sp. RSCCF101]